MLAKLKPIKIFRIVILVVIAALALALRGYAANRLNVGVDEPVYLKAALNYSEYLREGMWKSLSKYSWNNEHPSFAKVVYGLAELRNASSPDLEDPHIYAGEPIQTSASRNWILTARHTSAILGSLAVFALGILNPVAGFFLAIHSLGVRETSGIYLESLPMLSSLLSALTYLAWFRRIKLPGKPNWKNFPWLLASAIFLGTTAASKYPYLLVGVVIAVHYSINAVIGRFPRRYLLWLMVWMLFAIFCFYIMDVYLWEAPIEKLGNSLGFFIHNAHNSNVDVQALPFYQPLYWLSEPVRLKFPHDANVYKFDIDFVITGLALIGIYPLFKNNRFFFIWFILGLAMVMIWPARWPQYTMIVLVPFCVSAAEGFGWLYTLSLHRLRLSRDLSGGTVDPSMDRGKHLI